VSAKQEINVKRGFRAVYHRTYPENSSVFYIVYPRRIKQDLFFRDAVIYL